MLEGRPEGRPKDINQALRDQEVSGTKTSVRTPLPAAPPLPAVRTVPQPDASVCWAGSNLWDHVTSASREARGKAVDRGSGSLQLSTVLEVLYLFNKNFMPLFRSVSV